MGSRWLWSFGNAEWEMCGPPLSVGWHSPLVTLDRPEGCNHSLFFLAIKKNKLMWLLKAIWHGAENQGINPHAAVVSGAHRT